MTRLDKYWLLSPPIITASADVTTPTTVNLTHVAVIGAASYVYYEDGVVITPTMTGAGTLTGQRTGRTSGQSYQYQVSVVDAAGREGPKSAAAVVTIPTGSSAYPGTVTTYFESDFEGVSPTDDGLVIWSPSGHDAYDHTVDNATECVTTKSLRGSKSLRVQLTAHRYGSNTFPATNGDYLLIPGSIDWRYKNAGGPGADLAHRNELKWDSSHQASLIQFGEEHWMGFAVFLPGESDPDGDWPWRAVSWWSYSFGPQLHPSNIPGQDGENPSLAFMHGSAGWRFRAKSIAGLTQPAGAPVIRYRRGGDMYNPANSAFLNQSTDASKLRVEWNAISGAVTYRVRRSVRSSGPWEIVQDAAARTYALDGLGTNTSSTNKRSFYIYVCAVMADNSESPASLICPAGRDEWGAICYGASGEESWSVGSAMGDRGRWVKWVFRYKLSNTNTGFVEAWKDGTKVVSRMNINLGSNNPGPHYWRMGIYADVLVAADALDPLKPAQGTFIERPVPADWPARETIYYDDLRMARRVNGPTTATDTGDPAYIAVAPRG